MHCFAKFKSTRRLETKASSTQGKFLRLARAALKTEKIVPFTPPKHTTPSSETRTHKVLKASTRIIKQVAEPKRIQASLAKQDTELAVITTADRALCRLFPAEARGALSLLKAAHGPRSSAQGCRQHSQLQGFHSCHPREITQAEIQAVTQLGNGWGKFY